MNNWQKFLNRIRQEIQYRLNNNGKNTGIVMINIRIIADSNEPLAWTVDSSRFEPGSKMQDVLNHIVECL